MAHYFLHIRNGDTMAEDLEGEELPDLDAARAEAQAAAREILAERVRTGQIIDGSSQFEITDGTGKVLDVVRFRDALRLD